MKSFLAFALLLSAPAAFAGEWSGNVNLFLGSKVLSKGDWDPVERQGGAGIELDFKKRDWPLSVAVDIMGFRAQEDLFDPTFGNLEVKARTSELNLGVRKIWDKDKTFRPFLGGGLALMGAEFSITQTSTGGELKDDDRGFGLWLAGGAYWTFNNSFSLGIELKHSTAQVKLFGVEADAGGAQFGALFGYHWGPDPTDPATP